MSVAIQADHVIKRYGDLTIIPGLSESIENGEFFTLLGPSGCGKTTLLRMIAGFNTIEGGEIKFNDTVINDIPAHKRNIGMVFQSYELFPHKTILENILLAPMKVQKRPRSDVEKEALELLERVGLADRKDDYPRQLSGGQKQRVAIVRAMCMHPEILLLDEITAALDPEMVREVLDVVLSLAKAGSTMVIVTHEMNFARAIADRILFIENGAVVEQSDDPKAFFASPETDRAKAFLKSFDYE